MMIKHLGDITKINGAEIPVVDIITGGSPCQDLSVAGLRKGLQHGELGDEETTRSGLFMDQLRIVKEMRAKDVQCGRNGIDVRPRYMVWENVPGAFSVNQGKDFQAVLTEIVRVIEPTAPDVPMPEKGWPYAGCLYGELGNWSIAYRVHDAQFWGVPQRRRRIALVADFNGLSAAEILFDPQLRGEAESSKSDQAVRDSSAGRRSEVQTQPDCLQGHSEQSGPAREGTPGGVTEGADGTGCSVDTYSVPAMNSEGMLSNNPQAGFHISDVARTVDPSGLNPACYQGGRQLSDLPLIAGTEQKTPFVNWTLQSKKEGHNLNTNMVVRVPTPSAFKTPDTDGGAKATLQHPSEPRLGGWKGSKPCCHREQTSTTEP